MLGKATLGMLAVASLLAMALGPQLVADPPRGAHAVHDATVESFDGTLIAVTVFQPAGASREAQVPVIVRSHGWAASRETTIEGPIRALLDAGYGVVTMDMRGHGGSGGLARIHDPDFEIRDVSAVFDFVHDHLAWVEKEPGSPLPKDVRAGGSGGSYGGAWQLLFAQHDGRIDVLVPEITWHALPQALAPNGAVASDWVHLFYGAAKLRARVHPDVDRWYAETMATNALPPDALAHLERASPAALAERLAKPTLLVQGTPDTLFNLNHALANLAAVEAAGAPARLVTHLDGHLLNPGKASDGELPDVPFPQAGSGGHPCGSAVADAVAWYDRHLKGLPAETGARVTLAMDDGTCLRLDALPPLGANATLASAATLPSHAGSLVLPVLESAGTTRIAGVPALSFGNVVVAGADDLLYASLVVLPAGGGEPRTLASQVTPVRLAGPRTGPLEVELGGVGAVLADGDRLVLRLDRVNEQYATNWGRLPSALTALDVRLALPLVDQ